MPKTHDIWDLKYVFTNKTNKKIFENDQLDTFYPTYYARIGLQMP
jgi:hypothetical protein